jgi:hypothetical protein
VTTKLDAEKGKFYWWRGRLMLCDHVWPLSLCTCGALGLIVNAAALAKSRRIVSGRRGTPGTIVGPRAGVNEGFGCSGAARIAVFDRVIVSDDGRALLTADCPLSWPGRLGSYESDLYEEVKIIIENMRTVMLPIRLASKEWSSAKGIPTKLPCMTSNLL